MRTVHRPRATKRTAFISNAPHAWCPTCQAFRPSSQVSWDAMVRDRNGRIIATYAAVPHYSDGSPA